MTPTDLAAAALGGAIVHVLVRAMGARALAGPGAAAVLSGIPDGHPDAASLRILGLLDHWVGPGVPIRRFVAVTALATAAGMAIALTAFIAGLPPHFAAFGSGGGLWAFLSRFLASQAIVAFVVNYLAYTMTGLAAERIARAPPARLALFIVADLAARLALFAAVSAGIYAAYARLAGSFGGSWRTAIAVVPDTMVSALRFNNLTGVVLYGVLACGFPLFLAFAMRTAPAGIAPKRAAARMAAAFALAAFVLSLAAAG
ncbi:hypothetical protein ACLB6G_16755 [Zhengella sp. ZM62]|uniref:hypothetical protein n=1 Tax=Zhengella sedimenti TaxID=3390035 RepID=UPI003976819A